MDFPLLPASHVTLRRTVDNIKLGPTVLLIIIYVICVLVLIYKSLIFFHGILSCIDGNYYRKRENGCKHKWKIDSEKRDKSKGGNKNAVQTQSSTVMFLS